MYTRNRNLALYTLNRDLAQFSFYRDLELYTLNRDLAVHNLNRDLVLLTKKPNMNCGFESVETSHDDQPIISALYQKRSSDLQKYQ